LSAVTKGASFRAGAPHELFKLRPDHTGFDFHPDGKRVLVAAPAGPPMSLSITIDVNWASQLRK